MAKKKAPVFSAIKAVKANARERLGSPPPERVLPHTRERDLARPKHKQTLETLLNSREGSE